MSLTLKFYKYDEKNICDFFKFFINFISSCAQGIHIHMIRSKKMQYP
jgi:hypothetical protein